MGGMERIKAERNEQQSDRVESRLQNRCYLGRFEVEKCDLLLKMIRADFQTCCSYCSGEHNFRKIMKQSGLKMKNGAGRL